MKRKHFILALVAMPMSFVPPIFAQNVAKVGNTEYATLADAISEATAGQTITLLADVEESKTVVFDKALNIDGDGHTFTGAIEFNKSSATYSIKDVKFNGAGTRSYALKTTSSTAKVTVEGCTATDYTYGFLHLNKSTANVVVKDVTVNDVSYGVHSVYGTSVTLENYTATNVSYPVYVQNYGSRNVVLNNCTFTGCENPLHIWERNQTHKITFNFKGVNEMGKADFCTSAMAVIKADAMVGTKVYETLTADALAAVKAGDLVKLYADTDIAYELPLGVVLEKNSFNAPNLSVEERKPAGHVAYRADVTDKEDREGIAVLLKEVYAENSLVVKVYHDETLMFTCTRRDIDDESKVMFPVNGTNTTANIVLWGKESGSWINEILVAPTEFNVPNRIEIWADNVLVQDYTHDSGTVLGTNLEKYLALECVKKAVAEVNGVKHFSLAEAVEAAEAGATVTLLTDATGAGVVIDKNVTIDFAGKTYTVNQTVGSAGTTTIGFQILKGNDVTLKNGTLTSTAAVTGSKEVKMLIQNYANLTLEDMNLVDNTEHIQYVLSNNCGNTVLTGATNITTDAVAFDVYDYTSAGYAVPTVTVETTGTIEGGIEVSESINDNLQIKSGTFTTPILTEWCAAGYMVQQDANGYYAVVVDPVYGKVAKIGDNYYATLSEAIENAKAGQTITLLADINEDVTINKSLTIDGDNKKYTGTMGANNDLTVTVQNVNFVNGGFAKNNSGDSGTYTIKDCTFDGAGSFYYAVRIKHAKTVNIQNCTVKNYLYSFLYVSHCVPNVNVKNVTVDNCPSYAVYFASGVNNATFEGLTVKNGNNGFVINNTANRSLTIKDCTMENVKTAINYAGGTKTITVNAEGENNFGGAAISQYVKINGTIIEPVAQVGDDVYYSLSEAFAAAQDGETVKMLADVALGWDDAVLNNANQKVLANVDGKNITFDMNGKKIAVEHTSATDRIYAVICVEDGASLTVTGNGTIDVVTGHTTTMPKVAYMFWKRGTTGALVIENGNFHMDNSEDSMVYTNGDEIVTVNGGTFILDAVGTRTGSNGFPWIFSTQGNNEKQIVVTGGTYNWDIRKQHWANEVKLADGYAMAKTADNLWTVAPAVAAIDGFGYITLAEAIEAAKADDIVTLVADIAAAGVVIDKDVTIDFAGKTYTFNEGVGSTGTESNGFQILKGNTVVLKNGTLNVADEAKAEFYTIIQNYADLTVEDMTLDGTNLDKWSATDGDSYVLSVNSGNVLVTGNTNITANNDGDKAFAFDACDKTAWGYTLPVVNVETTGKIAGLIESTATIAISGGIFTTPILPEWCAQYYAPVDNGDGTYGVVYTYVDEMTIDDDKYFKGEMPAEGFVNKNEQTVGTLTYKRTFNKVNVWQALYVPFEIPVAYLSDLGYEVAYLYDVHNKVVAGEEIDPAAIESVHFVKITKGTLRASYPYIIRPTSEADLTLSLTLYDAKLYSTDKKNDVESSTTTTRYIFTGTYADAYSTDITGNANVPCARINDRGNWQKMTTTAILVPFRICMYIVNKDGSPVIMSDEAAKSIKIRIVGEENEDETTGIKFYEFDNEQASDYIYDLHGRRVMEPQKGSIYIVNGKKVVF